MDAIEVMATPPAGVEEPARAKGAKRRRRSRTSHPGVKLVEVKHRSGVSSWVARWSDPDDPWTIGADGKRKPKTTQASLDKLGLTTHEARRAWAVTKSRTIAERRAALAAGAPRHQGKTLADTFRWYFDNHGVRLRARTREVYEADVDGFKAWASSHGVASGDDLRQEHLTRWVAWLAARPRARASEERGDTLASATVNKAVSSLRAVLNKLRKAGMVPHLSRDAIADGLTLLRTGKPLKEHLTPTEARQLLAAALRHDSQTFKVTRKENAAGLGYARTKAKAAGVEAPTGGTPKYEPAAPLLACLLLTGMRDQEARLLRWDQVDLDARDERGELVGEIRLGATAADAEDVKTGAGRIVDLAVSPALRLLLVALKLRAGDVKARPYVFAGAEPFGRGRLDKMRLRLARFGAPPWGPQKLRRTCATALVNSFGIWGGATVWRAAKHLGHSAQVLEKHYAGLMRVPREAHTLEAVLQVEEELRELVARVSGTVERDRREVARG